MLNIMLLVISLNKLFGDIMVLACSPPRPLPRPPVDPDNLNILSTSLLKFDTLRVLEQLRLQPNDTLYPPNL